MVPWKQEVHTMQGPLGQHPAGQQAEGQGMWARASLWFAQEREGQGET